MASAFCSHASQVLPTQIFFPMSTLLFCTSYIRDNAEWTSRYARWIEHYRHCDLGAQQLFLIDDGSPYTPPADCVPCLDAETQLNEARHPVQMLRFSQRLGRPARLSYPGWWRSFTHSVNVARALGVRKIIHVESDAVILSERLRDYVSSLESGWTVLWSEQCQMPESAIQVICEDQFEALAAFANGAWRSHDGVLAEHVLPFTHVAKDFVGDRYADVRRHRGFLRSRKFDRLPMFQWNFFWEPIPAQADFVTQVVERQWQRSDALRCLAAA